MPVYPSGGTIAQSAGSPGFGPAPTPSFNASASVRFNPADTPNIGYVPTLQGSRTTFTFSAWVKRSLLGAAQTFFGQNTDTNNHGFFEFQANDALRISSNLAASQVIQLVTTQVFRDPSQWYNIVIVFDLTNATQADRVRLFVNGVRVTAFSTSTIPANTTTTTTFNASGVQHYIGRYAASSIQYFGGYLADMNFVDGLALTPSSFTATDANTGQLVPAQYTGSFGLNGFYLPLSSAALAVDLGQNPKTTAQDFPYWPYNTLLVDTTSTNGAQNNTFLDSSTNNFTITRNGNTTQGNFTPFNYGGGTTQANGYYSGYFDGTGDYLTAPYSASLDLTQGNFTVEAWVYRSVVGTVDGIICQRPSGSPSTTGWAFRINAANTLQFFYTSGSSVTSTATIPSEVWTHIAATRSGSTAYLFINGILVTSTSFSNGTSAANTTLTVVGAENDFSGSMSGYISNLRVINGTAVYTSNFTVPTAPLTAVTNTSLLTCQSSQFIDNSANAFAVTAVGNSQPLPTNPFGMTAWSGAFDGTNDNLLIASTSALDLPGDFTIECWVNFSALSTNRIILDRWSSGVNGGWQLYWRGTGTSITFFFNTAVVVQDASTTRIQTGIWYHIAAVRSGTTCSLYIDGQFVGSGALSLPLSPASVPLCVGEQYSTLTNDLNGYVSNVRIVGSAVYTSNFTPSTTPLTAIAGTKLLTCQSSTFIDNSTNALPITVNGNSYTLTLNNPFGNPINYTTPPVQGWSTYFDGSGDYISTTPTALTYGIGTGLFTWESWIYTVNSSATAQGIWHYYTTVTDIIYPYIVSSTGTFNCTIRATNQASTTISSPSGTIRLNQWHHVVFTRDSSTTISLYVDGKKVAGGTIAASTSFADTVMNTSNGNNPVIGAQTNTLKEYFYGYISNLRFVRGSVVYTANFTPPTAPLTAVPGTMTLACQSNRVRDNSILNAAQVANGNAFISSLSPFIPTQAWSAASYGGAMYFDGTGDYLTAPNSNASYAFAANFTIQCWINPQTVTYAIAAYWTPGTATSCSWVFSTSSSFLAFTYGIGGTNASFTATTGAIPLNTWSHVAVSRSGSTLRLFVNGQVVLSTTLSGALNNVPSNPLNIGRIQDGSGPFTGYMSNLQIVNGTAVYTTPFVPPVLPVTAVSNTTLLLNATNSGIYDATGNNPIETVGNAQVTTAVKKFGESSISFDGSGDYLIMAATQAATAQFGTADFTVEGWFYPTNVTTVQVLIGNRVAASGANNWDLGINASSKINWGTTSTTYLTSSTSALINTWQHIAVCRVSGTTRLFLNGVLEATTTSSINLSANSQLNIGNQGSYSPTSYNYIGYMQDVRISKGVGRYSGNFTPPAAAFAYNQYDIGNQQWLPTNISVTAGVGQDNLVDSPSDYGTDTGLGGQVRGNYATLNPLVGTTTLANGNLQCTGTATPWQRAYSTIGMTSGKWYAEVTLSTPGNGALVGISNTLTPSNATGGLGYLSTEWAYYSVTGNKYNAANLVAYGATWTTNDVIGIALDLDAGTLQFYKNGVDQGIAYSSLTSGPYYFGYSAVGSPNSTVNFNFGQRAFAYAAPSGFKCLVSTNLPTTNGIGATSSTRASNYFNANIWTGNGTQIPVGFDPSLIWYKSTNAVSFGGWVDQIRGDNYYMQTWDTAASTLSSGLLTTNSTGFVPGSAFAANSYVSYGWRGADTLSWSFDGSLERTATMTIASPCVVTLASNGFSAGQAVRFTTTGALPTGIVAGTTYYAGNMVGSTFNLYDTEANAITGGATGRVNTSGSQSGTQTCEHAAKTSANPTSGFSVTQYIGVGGTTTVPHGLGAAPEMYIIKCASTTGNWLTLTTALDGSVDYAYLNGTQNLTNAGPGFSTLPTSTVVSLGTDPDANTNGVTYMLYSYVSIPGFSKVGVYTGNGAADGPMIYTNFSPEMLMLKRVSGTPVDSWYNLDLPRDPYNVVSNFLAANSSQAQSSATFVDFLSNGFKVRAAGAYQNAAGSSYLYLAIASAPFKYSRAR